jgi:hypothetical protein
MNMKITLPKDETEYDDRMAITGRLLTAVGWERAALVAMKVEPNFGDSKPRVAGTSHLESARTYSERGYHGLKSKDTVLLYARAWLDRFPRPNWGESVKLPTIEFPPTRQGTDGYETQSGAKVTLDRLIDKHGATVIGDAILESPEIAEIAARALNERVDRDATFDKPPKMPWDETPNSGMTLSMQISAINMRLRKAIELLDKYELGSDPVTDQALADSMNVVEQYYDALRDVMGLDMMT